MVLSQKITWAMAVVAISLVATPVFAAPNSANNFMVASSFDASGRGQVQATLVEASDSLHFYIDTPWWDAQPTAKKTEITASLGTVALEFKEKIYPTLTLVFGSEWRPGVDGSPIITVLLHPMKNGASGYFRSNDEYLKLQVPDSNEREMVYLSTEYATSPQLKVFLAHEFTHLIEYNQKTRLQGLEEDVWLAEARADFTSTILGYDIPYDGSNLQRRVKDFSMAATDPLTEWNGSKYDYAVVSVFTHYLVDQYGIGVLTDSLKLSSVGIQSINEVLRNQGVTENFSQIFTNWTVATLLNDCSLGVQYCYLTKSLSGLRISPTLNFLPLEGNSSLSVTNVTKNWAGNWQKIIGGNGNLHLDFSSLTGLNFQVPYVVIDKNNKVVVNTMVLDKNQKGSIDIKNFGTNYAALVIMPSLQSKLKDFGGPEFTYPYTFSISFTGAVPQEDPVLIQKLLAQIELLKKQIADLQAQQQGQNPVGCVAITNNLYLGLRNNAEVSCLQQFLKNQGPDIYPEGLVTGNFGSFTKAAAIRFQAKFGIHQTGYVGILTRTKINSLLLP